MNTTFVILLFSHVVFSLCLAYYFMSAFQWYSYRIKRVIFNFNKPFWHFAFFVLPVIVYYIFFILGSSLYFLPILYFIYIPALIYWYKKLDKPLKFTNRIKRFFIFFIFFILLFNFLCIVLKLDFFTLLLPLILAVLVSNIYEKIIFLRFKNNATKKLLKNQDLKIVAITGSYGKTSIKNFLYHILSSKFNVYKTPRSVNTLSGLVLDVNTSLPDNTQIYIAEAGAREQGDIKEIADFLLPNIVIVGQIGAQHLEYFKSIDNIKSTKLELISSKKLQKAFLHVSTNFLKKDSKYEIYGDSVKILKSDLDGLEFSVSINGEDVIFKTSLLGTFNALNLEVCIRVAIYFGMKIKDIKDAILNLKSVEHRLQRIDVGGKIIIDDSFNGNFEGMESSYELISKYSKRKILITPGIIESNEEENVKLAKIIDKIFDLVIITGSTNMEVLNANIVNTEKILLKDKAKLTNTLALNTKAGDLILFSNDAPTYM